MQLPFATALTVPFETVATPLLSDVQLKDAIEAVVGLLVGVIANEFGVALV